MKVNFMVLCDYANRMDNGSPILCGIFRGVNIQELPGYLAPFWLAVEIEAEPNESGEHEFDLRLVDEDGQVFFQDTLLGQFKRRNDYQPSFLYCATVIHVMRPIAKRGVYRFDLVWNGEMLHQSRLDVS
jgi:hypothetical protein